MALYNVWHTESGRNTRQYDVRSREDAARLWFSEEGGDSVKVTVELIKTDLKGNMAKWVRRNTNLLFQKNF